MSIKATLPGTCRCGSLKAILTGNQLVCTQCGRQRGTLCETTTQFLASVTARFGEPTTAIFRKPQALKRIAEQDAYLKHNRTFNGETWFDIIMRELEKNRAANPGFTLDPKNEIPENEIDEIAPAPDGAEQGNDDDDFSAGKDIPDERE
jgi:hypothetical protein